MEFCLHFFDLLGSEMLEAIDETRRIGFIPRVLNSTHITLIPKKDTPYYFHDYCQTDLCNLLYKIISKIIAGRLKPYMDIHIGESVCVFIL